MKHIFFNYSKEIVTENEDHIEYDYSQNLNILNDDLYVESDDFSTPTQIKAKCDIFLNTAEIKNYNKKFTP